jgi:hypothetical protein
MDPQKRFCHNERCLAYARAGEGHIVIHSKKSEEAVEARLVCRQGSESAVINTAYIERLQATLRSRLAPLARRTRAAARHGRTLEAGMWLIGTAYNFCCWHRSLRLPGDGAAGEQRWIERTPAQAAGLTFSKVGRFMSCLS